MAKTRKLKFTCPASVDDRKVKKGIVAFTIDPSPNSFLLKSKARQKPVAMLVVPDKEHEEIEPIPLFGVVKSCKLEFESVSVPDARLADLEFLIREKNAPVELRTETEDADLFADSDSPADANGR